MMVEITHSENPYVMDMVTGCDIAALTRKNSDFIEAVLKLDSNYKKESQYIPPHKDFKLDKHASKSNRLYCGSTKFWFDEMAKDNSKYSYEECVLGAVISIDRSNSTHLETTQNGRKEMAKRITKRCPDIESLRRSLLTPFKSSEKDHLISCMIRTGFKSIKDGSDMYYLSFASKFCSYASSYLGLEIDYSKYDNVVAKALPKYCMTYCNEKVGKTTFLVKNNVTEKYKNRLGVYEKYSQKIAQIIDTLDKNNKLTRDEFDHVIWYGSKGS